MLNRDKIIASSLTDLDLSPTMEKNARDKYVALSNYLDEQGLDSDFYPQGSFLIGTTVRPYRDGKDHDYDLDVLAILQRKKDETDAESVKNDVGNCIKKSRIYADKLQEEDRNCWTLKYAEISSGVGFSLDIVPSVDETAEIKDQIIASGVEFKKVEKTVAITEKKVNYKWMTSNPLGFGDWFLEISNRHLSSQSMLEQYRSFPDDLKTIFASAEKIPHYYYRSNLQKAVQFIKRHRDIFYDRSKLRNDKPSSILLTALAAESVKDQFFLSIADIVNVFISRFKNRSISIMKDGKILNPVDMRENLIDDYSEHRLQSIDRWIEALSDLMSIEEERKFEQKIHNDINIRLFTESFVEPKIIEPTKPWKKTV